jgi:hypothetical protein
MVVMVRFMVTIGINAASIIRSLRDYHHISDWSLIINIPLISIRFTACEQEAA